MEPKEYDSAVIALLKQPALKFSRELRRELDKDPEYANKHKPELIPQIDRFLDGAGIHWRKDVIEDNVGKLVRDLAVRLRSIEKG